MSELWNTKNARMIRMIAVLTVAFFGSLACGLEVDSGPVGFEPSPAVQPTRTMNTEFLATQGAIPTLTLPAERPEPIATAVVPNTGLPGDLISSGRLIDLYNALNPGVVNIRVFISSGGFGGEGAGSGFVLDDAGHIVTNDHVVESADQVSVVFYNGVEAEAEVVGMDADSDLAVLRVEQLADGVIPLPLGNSDLVQVGEGVVAIGNPFGRLGNSMSFGIVSAVGREIPSLAQGYNIPQAIQTDAAINPGNSGGPLINLQGEVIGVNAQIATGGVEANAGVGFAIPSNIVRQVVPVLIEQGAYEWPYLGITGDSVSLLFMRANGLESQFGAYIQSVTPGGAAERAGLRGASRSVQVEGVDVLVGGDVIVEVDGKPVIDYGDLLAEIIARRPGDSMLLTIIRDGERQQVEVVLDRRP